MQIVIRMQRTYTYTYIHVHAESTWKSLMGFRFPQIFRIGIMMCGLGMCIGRTGRNYEFMQARVCMYVYVCVCMCMYVYVCIYNDVLLYVCRYVYACVCVCMYLCMYVNVFRPCRHQL